MLFGNELPRRVVRVARIAGLLFLLAACAATSAVKKGDEARNEFAELPEGAFAYIRINVKPARALLDSFLTRYGLGTKTVKTFFDRTDTAVAALYPPSPASPLEDVKRRFLMVADGKNYPAALSSFSLFFNPAWQKARSVTGGKYWHSQKNRLSLFMRKNKARISDADPFFNENRAEAPESFRFFSAGAQVAAWITNTDFLDKTLARMDIPVTIPALALFISAYRYEEDWQAVFRLETPGPAQARGLVSVLNLVRNSLSEGYGDRIRSPGLAAFARFLLAEPPYVDGSALILKSPVIPEAALAGLIASFRI
jgi:hypothetical protein